MCRKQLCRSATNNSSQSSVLVIHGDWPISSWWLQMCRRQKIPGWRRHHANHIRQHRYHDDVIKWKHFLRSSSFVQGIHRSPVNSPHKGQWRGTLMFSLICAWINGWGNNGEASDLRRHPAHYDVTVVINITVQLQPGNCAAGETWASSRKLILSLRLASSSSHRNTKLYPMKITPVLHPKHLHHRLIGCRVCGHTNPLLWRKPAAFRHPHLNFSTILCFFLLLEYMLRVILLSIIVKSAWWLLMACLFGTWRCFIIHGLMTWRRHQMETFSVLLAVCEGNPPVTGGSPSQRPVTRSLDVFLSLPEQTVRQTIETPVIWDATEPIMTSL